MKRLLFAAAFLLGLLCPGFVFAGTIAGLTFSSSAIAGGESATGTVTLGSPAAAAVTVALSSDNASATIDGSVVVAKGASLVNFTVKTVPVAADTTVRVSATVAGSPSATSPLTVTAPQIKSVLFAENPIMGGKPATGQIVLSSPAPSEGISFDLVSDSPAVSGTKCAVAGGATTGVFTMSTEVVSSNQKAKISTTFNRQTSTVLLTVTGPQVKSLTVSPSPVLGGLQATGTVALEIPAPSGGLTVQLTSDSGCAKAPGQLTIPEGASSATFTVSTTSVLAQTDAQIAAVAGNRASCVLHVVPPKLARITLSQTVVAGGSPVTGTVTLVEAAPAGGLVVNLLSTQPCAQVPPTVTVPAGALSASFTVTTSPTSADSTPTEISAECVNGILIPLTVTCPPVASITVSPGSISGGETATVTVTLAGAASATGVVVTFTSDQSFLEVPSSVTVAPGSKTATFTLTAGTVKVVETAHITAYAGMKSVSATLKVSPPSSPKGRA